MQLNFEESGQGPAIVLIHGLFGDLDNLKSLSRHLENQYRVINIDLRNHGQSPWTDTMQLPEMAADLVHLLDQLGIEQTHLLGHSLGGKVAMEFALRYPERVCSLIAADIAPVAYDARHTSILDALEALDLSAITSRQEADQQLAKSIETKGVRQFLLKNLRKDNAGWHWRLNLAGLRQCYPDLIGAPQQDGCFAGPVLFIRGGDSDYVLPEHRDAILKLFPQAESKTIAGTGHWLHAEKPSVFNGLVERFLAEQQDDS